MKKHSYPIRLLGRPVRGRFAWEVADEPVLPSGLVFESPQLKERYLLEWGTNGLAGMKVGDEANLTAEVNATGDRLIFSVRPVSRV